jgi:hypothetical protein
MSILGSVRDMEDAQKVSGTREFVNPLVGDSASTPEPNVLQFIFAAMWKLTEGDPFARKMLVAAGEEYSRRMDEFNGRR